MQKLTLQSTFKILFYFRFILASLILLINFANAAELMVTADRHEFFKNETLNVEIRIENASLKSSLDLSKLAESFQVVKQIRSSSHSMVNNKATRSEVYQLQLKAINFGKVTFPSLSVNSSAGILTSTSFPLNIKDEVGTSTNNNQLATIEASLQDTKLYLGEYAILKVKISLFSDIRSAQITIPESDIALVEKIYSTPATTKTINGKRIQVTELIYKIKPVLLQDIALDQIILTGQIRKTSNNNDNFFNRNNMFFSQNVDNFEEVTIVSNKIPLIKVLDLGKANIASTKFTKTQHISNIETNIEEPINLSYSLTTINNSADILPEIELANNELASFYKEKTLTSEKYDPIANEIVTIKTQNFTIIPKEAGKLNIDRVTIPWLNKKTNRVENLILSKATLTIIDPKASVSWEEASAPKELDKDLTESKIEGGIVTEVPYDLNNYLLITVILLFIYSTIITIKLVKLEKQKTTKKKRKRHLLILANDFDDLKIYLFQYFSRRFGKDIENFDDIKNIINDTKISPMLAEELIMIISKLENSLYGTHLYDFDYIKSELTIRLKHMRKPLFKIYTKNKN
ncbi:MAG: hypothetical protein HON23_00360 [Rickettsiales bacterium]|jgi:hypothetical protein|nr:hypothetical protein [Rickettsiales bacterium]